MIRSHLTYANVMATIAVFLALGGSAYAVKRIDGKDIAAHTIPASKLKKETLTREEIGPRAIGRSELSRSLRAALRDAGEPLDPLPGQDGYDGLPGEPGEPGEPGPPGTACDPAVMRLCPEDELPAGSTLRLTVDGADVKVDPAYRAGCTTTGTANCTVVVRGALPVPAQVEAWYQTPPPRDLQLTVEGSGGAILTRLEGAGGRPVSLIRHGDGFDLAITVAQLRQTAP
jgi:hypothetical protein